MGAASSKTRHHDSEQSGTPTSRRRYSRSLLSPHASAPASPNSPDTPDAEVVHARWQNLISSRRRRRNQGALDSDGAEVATSPILSTPGASADRDANGPFSSNIVPALGGDVQHICGDDAPVLSPKAATIAALTMETAAREEEEERARCLADRELPDRPEAARMVGAGSIGRKRRAARLESTGFIGVNGTGTNEEFGLSENWLIDRSAITLGKSIGHSSFGTVCEGRLNGTRVAVKTIKREAGVSRGTDYEAIAKEAEFNCRLRHPNIVLFMGITLQPDQVCIVTELMARGNVRDLLVPAASGKTLKLELSIRMQWALDTAQGMAYLHSLKPPMIHRDLKTTNLLVDRGMNVKICDFGLSRFQADDKIMTAVGTVQFAAPEVLKHERYSEKVDLFSYGTVLWELYTRSPVFDRQPQLMVYKAVIDGAMPSVDDACNEEYRAIMQDCWSQDPQKRPTFQQVITRMSALVDEE